MTIPAESFSVEELQAKRAMAMAIKYLDNSRNETLNMKRLSCFARTLRHIQKDENVSENILSQITPILKRCKDFKRQESRQDNNCVSPSLRNKNIVSKPSSIAVSNMNEEESIEKIQNLMFEQKEIQSKELSEERKSQEEIISDLTSLTDILKHTTLKINRAVVHQNMQLQEIHHFASKNEEELEDQKKKMSERTKSMGRSLWTSLGMVAWLIAIFVLTLVVMRLVPKPSPLSCPSRY